MGLARTSYLLSRFTAMSYTNSIQIMNFTLEGNLMSRRLLALRETWWTDEPQNYISLIAYKKDT